ncbi:MAG: MarR family winged helix-turn-helix transcriptional regulator [Novosphingobium sp.]
MGKPTPGDNADSEPAFDQLVRLLKLASFVNSPMKDGVCDPSGISQIEMKVLMALAGEGDLAGHDLVELMGVPAMNVSRALAALRDKGWIEGAVDPDNRRRRPVRLSAAGRAEYERLHPAVEGVAQALLGKLSPAQQRQFATISDKIIAAMVQWIRDHHEEVKV